MLDPKTTMLMVMNDGRIMMHFDLIGWHRATHEASLIISHRTTGTGAPAFEVSKDRFNYAVENGMKIYDIETDFGALLKMVSVYQKKILNPDPPEMQVISSQVKTDYQAAVEEARSVSRELDDYSDRKAKLR